MNTEDEREEHPSSRSRTSSRRPAARALVKCRAAAQAPRVQHHTWTKELEAQKSWPGLGSGGGRPAVFVLSLRERVVSVVPLSRPSLMVMDVMPQLDV